MACAVWKIVGDTGAMSVEEAWASALEAIRRGGAAPRRPDETVFEAVATAAFERYERL